MESSLSLTEGRREPSTVAPRLTRKRVETFDTAGFYQGIVAFATAA
jgi:hypothetical protein